MLSEELTEKIAQEIRADHYKGEVGVQSWEATPYKDVWRAKARPIVEKTLSILSQMDGEELLELLAAFQRYESDMEKASR